MNYHKFQKFSHVLSVLFNVLFWIIIVSGIITAAGFIYIVVNYDNLPNMVEELKYITPDDVSQFLKYSKGYLIMCLVEFFVATSLEAWLYKTISKTAKGFETSDCVFTLENYKNIKNLTKVFYCLALGSVAVVVLAGATLNETEALDFVLDETSLCLGLVFTFICFLFKQTARPVVRTIEIKQTVQNSENVNNQQQDIQEIEKNNKPKQVIAKEQNSKARQEKNQENKVENKTKRKSTTKKTDSKDE